MEGPKAPQPTDLGQVVDFFHENLRKDVPWRIQEEFPLAMNQKNLHNIRIIKVDNELASGAVMKMHIMKCAVGLFKVAAIGSVVTNPKFRNQGHSHKILQDCIQSAKDQICDIAILWSDLYKFYKKLGFELAGKEVGIVIEKEMNLPPTNIRIMESKNIAPEALLKVYSYHTTGAIRTVEDMRAYLKIPNSKIYTAWDNNNQILAYAIEGKGADLKGYIHEWGGMVGHLMSLFAHIRKAHKAPVTVIAPNNAQNLIRTLKQHEVTVHDGYLGMIKILNHQNFLQKVNRYAKSLGVDTFAMQKDGDKFFIGNKDKVYETNDETDIVRIIFGPMNNKDYNAFDKETADAMKQLFPISFWAWGWDSI